MATCSRCDEQTSMPFTCKFCEQSYCSAHRLPENHDCQGLESYKEQSREEGKVGYDVLKNNGGEPDITTRTATSTVTQRISSALPSLPSMGRGVNLPTTYILLGIMFAVFLIQVSVEGFSDMFALAPGQAMEQPWTIITSMFLHGSPMHLLVNAIVLASFGTEIERMLGDRKYLALLFAAGIMSSIGFTFSGVLFNMSAPAVGISGGLFGLVAFLAVVRPSTRVLAFFIIPLKIRTAVAAFGAFDLMNLLTQILYASGLVPVEGLYNVLLGVDVASSGHLSGLAVGLLYGYYAKEKYQQRRHRPVGNMYTRVTRL